MGIPGPEKVGNQPRVKWVAKLLKNDDEDGNYLSIETELPSTIKYENMDQVFCFSSQTVSGWKVCQKKYLSKSCRNYIIIFCTYL